MAKRIGKPIWLVEWQAKHDSGCKKLADDILPDVERMYVVEKFTIADVAKYFGVTYAPMQRYLKKHNLAIRSRSDAARVSKKKSFGLNTWRATHGSWCKGLTKDDPRMSSLIEKGRETQIRNGKSKGKNNPMYGKVTNRRAGFRKDLGHYVRSSWEANFARMLRNLGIEYVYEPEAFALSAGDTYTPDFYVPSKDKYYEIKGYDYNDKHLRFRMEYDCKLCLVDEALYSRLMKKFGDHIVVDCQMSFFSKDELVALFVEHIKSVDAKPSVRRFCKSVGISNKTIIKLFGSEATLIRLVQVVLRDIEVERVIRKYQEYGSLFGVLPTRRQLFGFYPRAAAIMANFFDGKFELIKSNAAKPTI